MDFLRRSLFSCVLLALLASTTTLASPRLKITPQADSFPVHPGETLPFHWTITNNGGTYTGGIRIILDIGPGGRFLGPMTINPAFSGGCTNGETSRTCEDSNFTFPSGTEIVLQSVIGIDNDAPAQIRQRTRVELLSPGQPPFLALDFSVDFLVAQVAHVIVSSLPTGMAQATGSSSATDSYVLTNVGQAQTTLSLTQDGSFFTQTPTTFTLAPGASQLVEIRGTAQQQGAFAGASIPSGEGVPTGLQIPVRLISANRPSSPPLPVPEKNRLDVMLPETEGVPVSQTVTFTNTKSGTVRGVFASDAPWLIVPNDLFVMGGGETKSVTVTIDPAKRVDALAASGSLQGTLTLRYLLDTAAAPAQREIRPFDSPGTATSTVGVVSTAAPAVRPGTIPPLPANELALYIPGVGHVVGSVGLFISDVTFTALKSSGLADLRLYYTGIGAATQSATVGQVNGSVPRAFGDIVNSVFHESSQVGSLQIRTADAANAAVTATVFNSSNLAGTFGTAIPVFRSDRSAGPGARIYLTGLRKDSTMHTNVYVQETSGAAASVKIDFYNEAGTAVGTRSVQVSPFALTQISDPLPLGAVSAVLSHEAGSSGRVAAYATPVDRGSGDTWAIADWPRQYNYSAAQAVVVPVAGAARGANNTYFRTDLALMNRGGSNASGTLRFFGRNGENVERAVSLRALESDIISDVTTSLFGLGDGAVGYISYTPAAGDVVITSRTYTTPQGEAASFGTAVPTVPANYALRTGGGSRRFGGFEDAAAATIAAARPATFRTNFGLLEVGGQPATVRATLRYTWPGQLTAAVGSATRDFALAPRQFMLVSNIASAIIGQQRALYGDLRNMQVEFQVISGSGQVIPFVSSVDNGTGDSISRTE